MNQERWQKIELLYHSARELPPGDRAAYLDESCADDAELRDEVSALLTESEKQNDFLSEPALTLGLSLIANEFTPFCGEQLGPYRIIRQIGRGGMGEVYLASDPRLERFVALKLLPKFFNAQDLNVRRFEQEARAASGASHPNVAHVYEIGEVEGQRYIAMEYVEGDNLRALLSQGPMSLSEAAGIALQVANALGTAHAAGIVHRDIKPENILIRTDGVVKVVDFGLAKLTEPQRTSPEQDSHKTQPGARKTRLIHTEPGMLMGTAKYMSPEQARGQEVDARTDIWSWGAVFYEMLAGQPPFTGVTNSDVIAEILKSEPPLLQTNLPNPLAVIFQKSLSKNKEDRYSAIPELLADLRRLTTTDEMLREVATGALSQLPETTGRSNQIKHDIEGRLKQPLRVPHTDITQTPASTSQGTPTKNPKAILTSPVFLGACGLLVVVLVLGFGLVGRRGWRSGAALTLPRITNLTNDGRVMDAAISGNGRLLAYVPIEAGKQSLWIRNLEDGEEWQLLHPDLTRYWGMRFTPDGQTLFYIATLGNDTAGVLYRIPVRGGPSEKLVANINAPPAVSPDGSQIAFVRSYLGQKRDVLIITNANGSDEREISSRSHPDKFSFSSASWSPDGKLIALGAGRTNETVSAVVGIPVDGGAAVELTPWQWAAVGGVAWDDDNRTLVFSARALGSRLLQLWRLSYPGREMQLLTDDESAYEEVTLASAANALVTTHTYEVSDIWTFNASGTSRRLTTQSHQGADGLTVAPMGRIIYTVGEYDQSILWGMNMDGGDRKPLIDNTGFLPSASQDGRFIAYVSTKGDTHHIWLMDTDGHNNRQLTSGGGENYPSVTPDGNWVIYTSLAKAGGSLWRMSPAGGPPIQLPGDGIAIKPVVSPDGTMIACSYRVHETDEWKIAVLDFAGGAPRRTFALPRSRYQMIRWTSDSQALIYLERREGADNLWRQPLDGSAPTQITNFTEDLILHHDKRGDEFVLSRGGRRRDIAMIKNYK